MESITDLRSWNHLGSGQKLDDGPIQAIVCRCQLGYLGTTVACCTYVYMHTYICMPILYMYIDRYMIMHRGYKYIYIYIYIYVYISIYTHIFIYIYIYITILYTNTSTNIYNIYIYIYIYIYKHAYIYIYMYNMYNTYVYIYIYMNKYVCYRDGVML